MKTGNEILDTLYDGLNVHDSIFTDTTMFLNRKSDPPKVEIEYDSVTDQFSFRLRYQGFSILMVRMSPEQFFKFDDMYRVQCMQSIVERDESGAEMTEGEK